MSGPLITFRKVRVRVPRELYDDPNVANYRARVFAHMHGIATPVVSDVSEGEFVRDFTIEELGDAGVAAEAKRSRR